MAKRLLVVDDDTIFRQMLIEILSSQGFEILEARDGEEGLELFKEGGSDLVVITDIRMPKKNGFQMAQDIHALSPTTPIIFISGWYDPGKIYAGKGIGPLLTKNKSPHIYFLRKPFRISQLVSLIEETTFTTQVHVA